MHCYLVNMIKRLNCIWYISLQYNSVYVDTQFYFSSFNDIKNQTDLLSKWSMNKAISFDKRPNCWILIMIIVINIFLKIGLGGSKVVIVAFKLLATVYHSGTSKGCSKPLSSVAFNLIPGIEELTEY